MSHYKLFRLTIAIALLLSFFLMACSALAPEPSPEPPAESLLPAATDFVPETSSGESHPTVVRMQPASAGTAIIIDHTTTDITAIPANWLEAAKQNVVWLYGHTSHGSQLVTGANYLNEHGSPPTYNFVVEWGTVPAQLDPLAMRLANDDGWSWDPGE
ncbi:MAG: hypothetical protein CVU38_06585, partial [Chloroflexi bacterium HGW-Chloroflexi-1]